MGGRPIYVRFGQNQIFANRSFDSSLDNKRNTTWLIELQAELNLKLKDDGTSMNNSSLR